MANTIVYKQTKYPLNPAFVALSKDKRKQTYFKIKKVVLYTAYNITNK